MGAPSDICFRLASEVRPIFRPMTRSPRAMRSAMPASITRYACGEVQVGGLERQPLHFPAVPPRVVQVTRQALDVHAHRSSVRRPTPGPGPGGAY